MARTRVRRLGRNTLPGCSRDRGRPRKPCSTIGSGGLRVRHGRAGRPATDRPPEAKKRRPTARAVLSAAGRQGKNSGSDLLSHTETVQYHRLWRAPCAAWKGGRTGDRSPTGSEKATPHSASSAQRGGASGETLRQRPPLPPGNRAVPSALEGSVTVIAMRTDGPPTG